MTDQTKTERARQILSAMETAKGTSAQAVIDTVTAIEAPKIYKRGGWWHMTVAGIHAQAAVDGWILIGNWAAKARRELPAA